MDYRSKIFVVKHGLSDEERNLTAATFTEFICENEKDIYLPH